MTWPSLEPDAKTTEKEQNNQKSQTPKKTIISEFLLSKYADRFLNNDFHQHESVVPSLSFTT